MKANGAVQEEFDFGRSLWPICLKHAQAVVELYHIRGYLIHDLQCFFASVFITCKSDRVELFYPARIFGCRGRNLRPLRLNAIVISPLSFS